MVRRGCDPRHWSAVVALINFDEFPFLSKKTFKISRKVCERSLLASCLEKAKFAQFREEFESGK